MKTTEKNGAFYKSKIKEQGRTIAWVAEQMGYTRPWMSRKLNELKGVELTDVEKEKLNEILGL